jgi:hypothetical protein
MEKTLRLRLETNVRMWNYTKEKKNKDHRSCFPHLPFQSEVISPLCKISQNLDTGFLLAEAMKTSQSPDDIC